MPRRPQKRTAERPGQQPQSLIAIDPLVGPGNPPHRHPPCPKTDQSRQHHGMVSLATCASSRRSESAHQSKYPTVMLGSSGAASFDRRAPLRQSLGRSESGLFRRWDHRESHHRNSRVSRTASLSHAMPPSPSRARALTPRKSARNLASATYSKARSSATRTWCVNTQLVDAESGAHLWADRFEESVADLFKLQDEVVARLASSLGVASTNAEAEKGARSKN